MLLSLLMNLSDPVYASSMIDVMSCYVSLVSSVMVSVFGVGLVMYLFSFVYRVFGVGDLVYADEEDEEDEEEYEDDYDEECVEDESEGNVEVAEGLRTVVGGDVKRRGSIEEKEYN